MKILIIDDDINATITFKVLLSSQGNIEVDVAHSGKEGLSKMMAADPIYDFLILDVMMSDFSGLDVCKAMSTDEKLKSIPIILASALPITSKELRNLLNEFKTFGLIKGALEKPFVIEDLLAIINKTE